MTIIDLYKTDVSTVSPAMKIVDLVKKMVEEHHNAYAVLDEEQRVVGVVSVQDIAGIVVPQSFKQNESLAAAMITPELFTEEAKEAAERTVADIMRTDFLTASKNTEVMKIAADFLYKDLYCVPVVEDGRLIGIFTRTEMRKVLLEAMK